MMEGKSRSIFAQRLRETRRAKGWSQEKFSELLDVNLMTLVFYETDRRLPKIDRLVEIAKLLEVSTDWLLGLDA